MDSPDRKLSLRVNKNTEASNFGWALADLQDGRTVSRQGWNGKNQFLTLQTPDPGSKMTLPYIYITTVTGDRVPWLASQADLLANDWIIFEPENEVDNGS